MITSTTNSQIKNLVKLNKSAKARREQQVFLAEGDKMFLEAPVNLIQKVFVSESYYNKKKLVLEEKAIDYEVVEDGVFKTISDTVTPQGILCVIQQKQTDRQTLLRIENPLFLLLEAIQDPGNLGTILRTAEAAGVNGIIMDKNTADVYNPKTIRSTMGAVYRVPFFYSENLLETAEQLKTEGISLYAAHLKGSVEYDSLSYKSGTAFMIGNEGNGLSEELSKKADKFIRIPMQGQAESLNAAVAAAILMYEAYRQRR